MEEAATLRWDTELDTEQVRCLFSTPTQRGMRRDAEHGRDHTALWHEVWVPNERDFEARFSPRERADVLVR